MQEKQKIAGVLQQSEMTAREMERFMKVSNKDFESLLLAEITKREKNTRMVHELEKSIRDICDELDSKLEHYGKKQNSIIAKMKTDIKSALIAEHKSITNQIVAHDGELVSLNKLLTKNYDDLNALQ